MTIPVILMLVGFTSLYYGAEWLVEGSIKLSANFNISKVVVGLVLVAFGTSSPELFVNLIAALNGRTGFALSNISGSNLTNLCIGFGVCTLVGSLYVNRANFTIDLIYFALTPLLIWGFMISSSNMTLPFWSAWPLLALFALYLYFISRRAREEALPGDEAPPRNGFMGLFQFLIGCGGLYLGGELVVRNAINIGNYLGISETVLGVTVVAFGTSIPDTVASIVAVQKKEIDIAVGNLLGSNIFNILLVLSSTLLFSGVALEADPSLVMDYGVVTVASIFFILLALFSQRIAKTSGLILILIYFSYILFRVLLATGFVVGFRI
ncbi:MAG: calcium/sodium antiporter [Anaerolineae bacterium]|nr:calcium/sodium antiporter [Anaerolineae bacterium]